MEVFITATEYQIVLFLFIDFLWMRCHYWLHAMADNRPTSPPLKREVHTLLEFSPVLEPGPRQHVDSGCYLWPYLPTGVRSLSGACLIEKNEQCEKTGHRPAENEDATQKQASI